MTDSTLASTPRSTMGARPVIEPEILTLRTHGEQGRLDLRPSFDEDALHLEAETYEG